MQIKSRLKKLEAATGFKSEAERRGAYEMCRRMGLENPEKHIHGPEDVIELLRKAYRNRDEIYRKKTQSA